MAGNAAEGSEGRTCTGGVARVGEGREGGKRGNGSKRAIEQASKRGRDQPPSRQRAECHGGEQVACHMHAASNPRTLFFASLKKSTVLYGE